MGIGYFLLSTVNDNAGHHPRPLALGGAHGQQGRRLHFIVHDSQALPFLHRPFETVKHPPGIGVIPFLPGIKSIGRRGDAHMIFRAMMFGRRHQGGGAVEIGYRRILQWGEMQTGAIEPD